MYSLRDIYCHICASLYIQIVKLGYYAKVDTLSLQFGKEIGLRDRLMINFYTNPFAQRLTYNDGLRSKPKFVYICLGTSILISVGALLDVSVFQSDKPLQVEWLQVIILVMSLSLLVTLPLFLTYAATAVTVTYSKSSEYPFLILTAVQEKEIVHGYLLATFYRYRALLAFVLPLSIGLSITMKSGLMQFLLYPDTWGFGFLESVGKHIIMGLLIAAVVATITLFGVSLGITLGLWWRHTMAANITAAITLFFGAFWWLGKTGEIISDFGFSGFGYDFLHALLYIPFPILLAWLSLRIAKRWARKAHFSR